MRFLHCFLAFSLAACQNQIMDFSIKEVSGIRSKCVVDILAENSNPSSKNALEVEYKIEPYPLLIHENLNSDFLNLHIVICMRYKGKEKHALINYHSIENMQNDIVITELFKKLAKNFWPGALTIIAKKKSNSKLQYIEDTNERQNRKDLPKTIK